jgi:hypothetical protein
MVSYNNYFLVKLVCARGDGFVNINQSSHYILYSIPAVANRWSVDHWWSGEKFERYLQNLFVVISLKKEDPRHGII